MQPDERQLLVSLKNGDDKAFDILFNRYAPRLYHFSLEMLKHSGEAEEIVQDTFLVVWENRSLTDPRQNFFAYLNAIARHKIYNVFRRRVLAKKHELSGSHPEAEIPSIEHSLSFDRLREILEANIARLSPYQKEILVLKTQELTNDEIAVLLNISKKTVEYHLSKAYKRLRSDMAFLKGSFSLYLPLIYGLL